MKKPRIFLGLSDHGCRLFALSLGFRAKGWDALYYSFYPEPNGADAHRTPDELPLLHRWNHRICVIRSDSSRPVLIRRLAGAASEVCRVLLLLWTLVRFDVVIFGAWNSFFLNSFGNRAQPPLWLLRLECRLFRLFRCKVIYTFWGGDSRPTYLDGMYIHGENWHPERVRDHVRWRRGHIDLINEFAHDIVDIPPQGQYFHRRPFALHSRVGMCLLEEAPQVSPQAISSAGESLTVLHTPSDPVRKGTALVESMVRQLQAEGFPINYRSATGISRKEVLALMRSADIFFDESYSDFPASCTTVEAGYSGAAPVSCGHSAEFWLEFEPEMTKVFGQMAQEDVLPYVRGLVTDPEKLMKARRCPAEFVNQHWRTEQVTERYMRLIDGSAPKEWYFDPAQSDRLLGGFFMPPEKARGFLREYLRRFGTEALCLDDKPALRAAIEEYSGMSAGRQP